MLSVIIFIHNFVFSLGLDLKALSSVSTSRFWPRLTSLVTVRSVARCLLTSLTSTFIKFYIIKFDSSVWCVYTVQFANRQLMTMPHEQQINAHRRYTCTTLYCNRTEINASCSNCTTSYTDFNVGKVCWRCIKTRQILNSISQRSTITRHLDIKQSSCDTRNCAWMHAYNGRRKTIGLKAQFF